ncbi:MAG: hypothetical protein HC796_11400 [Synechococcaceae cyanobacterium RL_1_2]|nr:hypothetical protein [Synechococcaceae cyanobacterium RL_1_2]
MVNPNHSNFTPSTFTDVDHEELAQLLQDGVQAYVTEGVELTRSLIANLRLLPPDPTLHHQRKGRILRDRRKLKELLAASPSLEAYVQQQCTAELEQISWNQILNPDFFGE